MNSLSIELLKGILEEAELPRKEVVGMFGGGFKPPTIGHLEVVKLALDQNPEMDRMVVLVGSGERDSITQKEALAIWRIYQKYLPKKVEIQPSPEGKPPIGAIYAYAKDNPEKDVYWFLGAREGNEEDAQDILKRTRTLRKGEYPNVTVKTISTPDSVSGTKTRKALLARDKETFIQALPDIPEVDEIWDMLSSSMGINEEKNPVQQGDQILAKKGACVYRNGKKISLKRRRLFNVLGKVENRLTLEDNYQRQYWVFDYNTNDTKWDRYSSPELEEEISPEQVDQVDAFADRQLKPIDVDLKKQHFFDRLNDPRNEKEITYSELVSFFKKLGKNKKEFTEFLRKYAEVVAKDDKTNINIPFVQVANKAIAKTIMRKKNFQTPSKVIPLQEYRYDQEVLIQSRYIINQLKANFKKKYTEEIEGNLGNINYNLTFEFIPSNTSKLGSLPYVINAAADEDTVEIILTYNSKSFPEKYNDLIAELKDTLRHELEHVAQQNLDKGVNIEKDQDKLPFYKYLTLGSEIPAFISGIYKRAKTKKIPLQQAIDDFFDDYSAELSDKEEQFVRKEWDRWIRTNLPKVKLKEADPKTGTGKKPKGSGRRLYTDENPKDTVGIKFKTKEDIVTTLNKDSFKSKPHARQSQVINLIHQRVRAAYQNAKDPETKARLKRGLDYIEKRKEASKEKTKRLNKQKKSVKEFLLEVIPTDIINSFDIQDTLVQDVWDGEKLKPEVREKLLKIAQDFFNSLDLPENVKLKDIKLTGSLANYNWSKFSDFDLHLVLDFSDIDDDEEFVRNYFMAKKGIWNDAYDITIYGFPVEVYVENEGESHTSSGLYSILNDEWVVVPKKQEVMIDKDDISTKAEDYISQTEDVQDLYDEGKYEEVIAKVDKIKERLRNMRSSGLEKGGEYSVENLAFKVLRRADIIGQLNDLKSKSYNTMMTINESMDVDSLNSNILSLTQYMNGNGLNLKPYPKVKFIKNNKENAEDLLGKTAYYDPNARLIVLYTLNRHPKDVLRSYAHELVHHHQNLNGTLQPFQTQNTNEDGDLEQIEREAYENGNILFRNWEDSLKNG
jgi:hypothetical protein